MNCSKFKSESRKLKKVTLNHTHVHSTKTKASCINYDITQNELTAIPINLNVKRSC